MLALPFRLDPLSGRRNVVDPQEDRAQYQEAPQDQEEEDRKVLQSRCGLEFRWGFGGSGLSRA